MRIQAICLLLLLATSTGCTVAERGKRLSLPLVGGKTEVPEAPLTAETFLADLMRGHGLEENEQWDKARTHYRAMITAYPDQYEPYHRLGVVADHEQLYREAQNLYSEALRRSPTNPQLFSDLGYSFFLEGELNKAESAMLKAVQLAPSNPRYLNNLGLVLGNLDRRDEALELFRLAGSEADAQYNLAFVYASLERPDLAVVCFENALQADPQHEAAQQALSSFRQVGQAPLPSDTQRNSEGYVPYLEAGDQTSSQAAMTLPPRSTRLVRSNRTSGFEESSQSPSMGGGF